VLHDEPEPRSSDPRVRREALSFPSDNPTKRIDLALVGTPNGAHGDVCSGAAVDSDPSQHASGGVLPRGHPCVCKPIVDSAYLIGQDAHPSAPVPDDWHESGGVGMTDVSSPLFASDHRGLVVKMRLVSDGTC
jgi:hypothetical protein